MLIENEKSRRTLETIAAYVASMRPGEILRLEKALFRDIETYEHKGALFTGPDRVLENIMGASYTHDYRIDELTGAITFRRYEDTGEKHYVSPDRRINISKNQ